MQLHRWIVALTLMAALSATLFVGCKGEGDNPNSQQQHKTDVMQGKQPK